jgi:hypothetical protein
MLEVALRNVVDRKLSAALGSNWYDNPTALSLDAGTCQYQQGCMVSARETLRRARKPGTHSEIIAQLNFGFWSSLFGKGTHVLWGTLRPAFQAVGFNATKSHNNCATCVSCAIGSLIMSRSWRYRWASVTPASPHSPAGCRRVQPHGSTHHRPGAQLIRASQFWCPTQPGNCALQPQPCRF